MFLPCFDKGERYVVMLTRSPIPGPSHLHGPPHYTWRDGQVLHLVDSKVDILSTSAPRND
jgi:hypothetical protein